jgi:hypothetical protein
MIYNYIIYHERMESRLVHGEEEGVDVVGRALQEAVHGVERVARPRRRHLMSQ